MRKLLLFGLLMFIMACAKKTTSSDPTCDTTSNFCSCDQTQTSSARCIEWEGTKRSSAQANCTTGTFHSDAGCATTGRTGTCTLSLLGDKTYYRYYTTDGTITGSASCNTLWLSTGGLGTFEWTDN